ncbi:MAG: arsenosugar biosynthesis radical SAM protein ArsS [Desulfobulbaceae bacterium]|nr:arsenosugar biosynthesis radical SAM protein ArsS [Desulfobulbaceae bacterium]
MEDLLENNDFTGTLEKNGRFPLCAAEIDILQVNLGYRCNLACKHCHVQAGPLRTEMMARENVESIIHTLENSPIRILDVTGGAPELHSNFRFLVTAARAIGCHVMVRSNLAIFFEEDQASLPSFYKECGVEIVASLPYFRIANVDAVRGNGVFERCIKALQILNEHGYGQENGGLKIHLVHNPRGAFLPPSQESLEAQYRKELLENFGVRFNQLYTLANMPLGRFKDFLVRSNGYDAYMEKLRKAFNPSTLDGIMCRRLVSVGWDGILFDCDFNLVAGLSVEEGCPRHIRDFDYEALSRRKIVLSEHCFGCTAGQGST